VWIFAHEHACFLSSDVIWYRDPASWWPVQVSYRSSLYLFKNKILSTVVSSRGELKYLEYFNSEQLASAKLDEKNSVPFSRKAFVRFLLSKVSRSSSSPLTQLILLRKP
jgi:hypothetical protein